MVFSHFVLLQHLRFDNDQYQSEEFQHILEPMDLEFLVINVVMCTHEACNLTEKCVILCSITTDTGLVVCITAT